MTRYTTKICILTIFVLPTTKLSLFYVDKVRLSWARFDQVNWDEDIASMRNTHWIYNFLRVVLGHINHFIFPKTNSCSLPPLEYSTLYFRFFSFFRAITTDRFFSFQQLENNNRKIRLVKAVRKLNREFPPSTQLYQFLCASRNDGSDYTSHTDTSYTRLYRVELIALLNRWALQTDPASQRHRKAESFVFIALSQQEIQFPVGQLLAGSVPSNCTLLQLQ